MSSLPLPAAAPYASAAPAPTTAAAAASARRRAAAGTPAEVGFAALLRGAKDADVASAKTDGVQAKAGAGKRPKAGGAEPAADNLIGTAMLPQARDPQALAGQAGTPPDSDAALSRRVTAASAPATDPNAPGQADARQSDAASPGQTPDAPLAAQRAPSGAALDGALNPLEDSAKTASLHTPVSTAAVSATSAAPASTGCWAAGSASHTVTPSSQADGAADAALEAAQAKVEAFSNGLKLARQHSLKDGRVEAHAAGQAAGARSLATRGAASVPHAGAATSAGLADAARTQSALLAPLDGGQGPASLSPTPADPGQDSHLGSGPAPETSTALARPASLSPDIGSGTWGLALSQHVVKMVNASQQHAAMQLNPSALGPLKVTLTLGEQELQAQFECTHSEVSAALEAALPQLRSALAAQGVALGHTSVQQHQPEASPWLAAFSAMSANADNAGNPGGSGSSQAPPPALTRTSASRAPQLAEPAPRPAALRQAPGRLDTYA